MTNDGPPSAFLFGAGFARVLPLAGLHIELGCHPGPHHGTSVPLWYSSPLDEQVATREGAGLFDRSYLGQYYVTGERAAEVLGRALATDPARIAVGSASRAVACREDGTILDLPWLWHLDEGRWLLLTGTANGAELAARIEALGAALDVRLHDRSGITALLSLQGPRADALASAVLGAPLAESIPPGGCRELLLGLHRAALARVSEVGEPGYLLLVEPDTARDLWRSLVEAGATSAGLLAHEGLRLEAGTLEAPAETPRPATPAACGLAHLVDLVHLEGERGARDFPGAEALHDAPPPERTLVALRIEGPRLARRGSRLRAASAADAGAAVAATYSRLLGAGLVLAYLPPDLEALEVDCDGEWQPASRVTLPLVGR